MNKKITTFVTCIIATLSINAQSTFEWAKKIGATNTEYGYSICTDATGNSYTLGHFSNTVDFNPAAATFTLTSNGGDDIFITKLDVAGNFVWTKKVGGTLNDYGNSIAIDLLGNLYITGSFQGTVDFDPNATVNNLTSAGSTDSYILKLDAAGNFVWAGRFGSASNVVGAFSIAVDNANNVLITGTYMGTIDFNPEAGVFNLTSAGISDLFAVKLNASGNFVWAKSWGGTLNDFGASSIRTDANGDVFCTGYFANTIDFDPSASIANLTSLGQNDIYILKLSSAGNFLWAKQVGGTSSDECLAANIDINNNIYLTGFFQGTVDFDPNASTTNLTAGVQDIFVLKLDNNGNYVWAKNMGGTVLSAGNTITNDLSGNVYVAGFFQSTVDFNPNAGVLNLTSSGSADIFILKLDASGNFNDVNHIAGTNSQEVYSMSIDNNYNIYTTGILYGTADFDHRTGTFNLTSAGGGDIFIHKMSQCVAPLAPTNATPSSNQTLCENNTTILSATSTGTVNWYATPTSTTVLASGTSYTTSALAAGTYTYYAEASTCTVSATRTEVTVTVNALPTITVNSGSICSGNSFTINPTGANSFTITGGSSIVNPTSNTSYSITGTSVDGCVSSNTAVSSVTVNALPTINASTSNNLMCTGESAVLTATGAVTYTWSTTENTNAISISPTVTTTYTVNGIDANGCENMSTITQSVSLCTGITLLQKENLISIYPNPSNAVFTISGIEVNSAIAVYNMVGKLVLSSITDNSFKTIDLTEFSSGIYFIKVKNSNQDFTQKLIKQ